MELRNMLSSSGSPFISQIIYPDVDLTTLKGDAYLIGWNLDSFRCSIACIVPIAANKLVDLNDALYFSSRDLTGSLSTCSKYGRSKPIVLGELIISGDSAYIPSPDKQARGIWITLNYGKSDDGIVSLKPKLHSLYSLGCKYDTSVYIFRYQRAASQRLECFFVKRTYRNQKTPQGSKSNSNYNTDELISSSKRSPLTPLTDLEVFIGHINTANELRNRLDFYLDSAAGRPINKTCYYVHNEPFVSSADRYFSKVVGYVCMALARAAEVWCRLLKLLTRLLVYRFEFLRLGSGISHWLGVSGAGSIEKAGSSNNSSGAVQGISMRELSLTAAFVSERASMCNLAVQKCSLFPLAWNLPCAMKQRLWLEVHALVLLIWVDVFLGILFGYFVFTHAESIVQQAGLLCQQVQSTYILETLQWFNHLPGGVKLNTTITQRMSSILTFAVLIFEKCLTVTQPLHAVLLRFIACCGGFGCSVQLVMLVDLLRLLSLHIALIHRVLSYFHHFLLQCLHSLWLLFNGQKNNILRKRIDTCYFGQDQLLFGIVQFSIVFFVFPNFAAYFFLFALAQFVCVAVQYVVYALSVLLKEFPYYEAVMFVTCPGIMSDGVQFSIQSLETSVDRNSKTCKLVDMPDTFSVNCLKDSWRNLSAPVVGGWPISESSHAERAKGSPKNSIDTRRRGVGSLSVFPATSSAKDATARSQSAMSPVRGRGTTNTSTNVVRPRGILKTSSSSNRARSGSAGPIHNSLSAQSRDRTSYSNNSPDNNNNAATERAVGRVTFHGQTVRTIEQYVSEGESGQSGDDEDQQQPPPLRGTLNTEESKQGRESVTFGIGLQQQTKCRPTPAAATTTITGAVFGNSHPMSRMQKHKSKHSSSGSTTYIDLKARSMSKTSLFVAYYNHMFYYSNERGVMYRLLRGIVSGRPALDIQLIHGTSDIVDRREATERSLMMEIVSLANSSVEARSVTSSSSNDAAHFDEIRRNSDSQRGGTIPRAVWALKASPSFAESIGLAWAGDDRQAFPDDQPSALRAGRGPSEAVDQETDALLSGIADVTPADVSHNKNQRPVPHSLHCRTLSRRMLFILLLTLCINFFMSMSGMVLFFASSTSLYYYYSNTGVSGVEIRSKSPVPTGSRATVATIMRPHDRNISEKATSVSFETASTTSDSTRISAATTVHVHSRLTN